MNIKKIAAHVFNGVYWSGWSTKYGVVFSIRHAASLLRQCDPELALGFYIINGNKKTAYVSDSKFRKKAADTAKLFFGVTINWFVVGYPKSKKCSEIIKRKKLTK